MYIEVFNPKDNTPEYINTDNVSSAKLIQPEDGGYCFVEISMNNDRVFKSGTFENREMSKKWLNDILGKIQMPFEPLA